MKRGVSPLLDNLQTDIHNEDVPVPTLYSRKMVIVGHACPLPINLPETYHFVKSFDEMICILSNHLTKCKESTGPGNLFFYPVSLKKRGEKGEMNHLAP